MRATRLLTNHPSSSHQAHECACKVLQKARHQRGFSLIELLVAMVLGLLVVGALIDLFIGNRRAYQVQSGNNYLQENLRIAADQMSWSLRMADFWGGFLSNQVDGGTAASSIAGVGSCTGNWATAMSTSIAGGGGVYGYNGADTFPLGTTCLSASANYVPGSDVLVLRYANPQTLSPGPAGATTPAESTTISGNPKQIFLLAIPGNSAQLFPGSTVPATGTDGNMPRYAYAYDADVYYLRPCSVPDTGGACSSASDNGMPLPTLMRMHLQNDGTLISEPVVDGIEQLKFSYGVLDDPGNAATSAITYESAGDVTTAGAWPNVVSVRIDVVSVNPARDATIPHTNSFTLGSGSGTCDYSIDSATTSTLTGCSGFTPFGGSEPGQFVRSSQQFIVQLRNRSINLGRG